MKVIAVDNLDRDTVPDRLIASNLSPAEADRVVSNLNEQKDPDWFYKSVPDDHILYAFHP